MIVGIKIVGLLDQKCYIIIVLDTEINCLKKNLQIYIEISKSSIVCE